MSDRPANEEYDFGERFMESRGEPIQYKRLTLILAEGIIIPIKRKIAIRYRIVSTKSEWRQGIAFKTDGWIQAEGEERIVSKWADVWEHTSPWEDTLFCYSRKKGIVWVQNVWDAGTGRVDSGWHGAAMWVEDIPGGKRYHCNDGHFDDDFDEIVFELFVEEAEVKSTE